MTQVKICGLTDPDDAREAVGAGADWIGMVFAPSQRRIDLAGAARIRDATADGPGRVGVFVNPDPVFVREAVAAGDLAAVQLHGDESPDFCAQLGVPVIKTLRVGRDAVDEGIERYTVDYCLVDTHDPRLAGGTGRRFDWAPAHAWARRCRLFLAGGLQVANVAEAVARVAPFAVDVSSGVEVSPGRKDIEKMHAFVEAVRAADRQRSLQRKET